jgi:osmoprotectant transport system ATP-binding protein
MIALTAVEKRYAGKVVVATTTLHVPARGCLALLGPSGCGKSTLLRIVLGLVTPDAGTVEVGGERVTPASAVGIRRRTGYVIQDGGLFPHLTAARNAALLARELGWDEGRIRARLDELSALVRLTAAVLGRYPGELSGGQRQRVGIMRALMLDPIILLLDEPLGALDPMVRRDLQEDLRRIFEELSKTVLLVTHDLAEAAYLCDEVALMRDGHILQRGTMSALTGAPADPFVREFLEAQRPLDMDAWRAAV